MTSARDFNNWNPQLHIAVLSGNIPADELRDRTLSFEYVDRDLQFDHIQWNLNNEDGMLTRPEHIAAGMIIQMKMGYLDGTFPWKSFILNRMRGGVGVYDPEGKRVYPVGDKATITLFGRNRNAPGGRTSRPWRRASARPAGGWQRSPGTKSKVRKKIYPATADITGTELLLASQTKPRKIKAPTTASAVLRIAERNGFKGPFAVIEDTQDVIESVTIPEGISDGAFLEGLAHRRHWVFKIDDGVLHFHSPNWAQAKHDVVANLVYGDGRDILRLDLDTDFRLPLPATMKVKGYDYQNRSVYVHNADFDEQLKAANIGGGIIEEIIKRNPEFKKLLTREEALHISGSGTFKKAKKASQQLFLQRYMRAVQLVAECSGNPVLLARKLIRVSGTGSPLVDNLWRISEARHTFKLNDVYRTIIRLKPPPKERKNKGTITTAYVRNKELDRETKTPKIGGTVVELVKSPHKQVAEPSYPRTSAKKELR